MGLREEVLEAMGAKEVTGLMKALELAYPIVAAGYDVSKARIVEGTGGFRYAQNPDGSIFVIAGPDGLQSIPIGKGSKAWRTITDEIGPYVAPGANPFGGGEDNPFEQDRPVDVYDELETAMGDLDDAIARLHDRNTKGTNPDLDDKASDVYARYAAVIREVDENDGLPTAAVRKYLDQVDAVIREIEAADAETERGPWEDGERERATLLMALLEFPDGPEWQQRYDEIGALAADGDYGEANRFWEAFELEAREYVRTETAAREEQLPEGYAHLEERQWTKFDDDDVAGTHRGLEGAFTSGRGDYKGVPHEYAQAIHAIEMTKHEGIGEMPDRQRLLVAEKAMAKLEPLITAMPAKQRTEILRLHAEFKKEIGKKIAEELDAADTGDGRSISVEPIESARKTILDTLKKMMPLEKAATQAGQAFETGLRAAAGSQKAIPIEMLEREALFDPTSVNSVSRMVAAAKILGDVKKYVEAKNKSREGLSDADRIALEVTTYKTVADVTKSVVEIGVGATRAYAEHVMDHDLADRLKKVAEGPGMKTLGGVLAVAGMVGNAATLLSDTATSDEKLDAGVGMAEGAATILEVAGSKWGGPVGAAIGVTWMVTKWVMKSGHGAFGGIMAAGMRDAYISLEEREKDIRKAGDRLVAVGSLMNAEKDAAVQAGMLERWNEVSESLAANVRTCLKVCKETNDFKLPGQYMKSLEPHFRPVVKKWGSVKGGDEKAVLAAGDVLTKIDEAFTRRTEFVQREQGLIE